MIIGQDKQKYELKYLHDKLIKMFDGKVNDVLLTQISGKFTLYIYHRDDQGLLENFVQEYFVLEKQIVDERNDLIDCVQSDEFKNKTLIDRIKIKHKLNKAQKMCDSVNEFEKEFFERTNISLLRVENERWAREKNEKKEQTIEQ